MGKVKNTRKRLLTFVLALAMVLTSVSLPKATAEAAEGVKVHLVQITKPKATTLTLAVGEPYRIRVKVRPRNAENKKLEFKSSKKKIAKIGRKGKIFAYKKGTTKLTVKSTDGSNLKATLTLKVVDPVLVKKVTLDKKSATVKAGKSIQLTATCAPKNATFKKVKWTSSNKKVATVGIKGVVKGVKGGKVTITATSTDGTNKKASATVTVLNKVPVKSVTLDKTSATVDAGKTTTLKATVAPANATDKSVVWESSDTQVATVSSQGVVTGIKAGTAKITATANDGTEKQAACTVTVKNATKTLDSIAVTKEPTKKDYFVGDKFDPAGMEVTATYSDGSKKVLEQADYKLTPATTASLRVTDKAVTISYTEGAVTKTATTPISVKVKPTVKSIELTTQPTKKTYVEGEEFDPAGMVITATLTDNTTKDVTADCTYSKDPLAVTVKDEATIFTISYKVSSSKTLTVDVPILVTAKDPLKSISAELLKTVLEKEGACFNDDDVKVTATFESGKTAVISMENCTVDPAAFTLDTTSATIKYRYGGVEKSVKVEGFTVTSYRERYTFEDAKTVGTVVKRANESGNAVPTEDNAGDVQLEFVDGVNGKALKMDGKFGLRLDKIAGTASKNYSISAWFKPDGNLNPNQALIISTANKFGLTDGLPETWCAIAGNDPNGTTPPSDNKLKLWSYDKDISWSVIGRTATAIPVGADAGWTHVALVVDNAGEAEDNYATGTLYVNGKKVTSGKVRNEKNELMKTYVGVTGWTADGYFKGLVDELVFTNEVLTDAEVEAYYLENAGNSGTQLGTITAVTPEENAEVNVIYGTSLADVKRQLEKITFEATVEGKEEKVTLTTKANMWTVEGYEVTSTADAKASVTLQAPDGYLFKDGDGTSLTMTRTLTIKIQNPATITEVTPSQTEITVPFREPEDAIKEQLAALTFAVTTSDESAYEIANAASLWTLTKEEGGYKAAFDLGTPKAGYKYADGLKVEVAVKEEQPALITGLTVDPNAIEVAFGISEDAVKAELAKLAITAQVTTGEAPAIANAAELWTITDYAAETAGTYTAKATIAAPTGFDFGEGVSAEITVTVTVKEAGAHVLDSIRVTTNPTKMNYIVGDDFDATGMVVTAHYADGADEDVTDKVIVASTDMVLGKNNVEISYSEGEADAVVEKTCTLEVEAVKVEDGAASLYTFDDTLANAVDSSKVGKTVKTVSGNKFEDTTVALEDLYKEDSIKGKSLNVNQTTAAEVPESIAAENKAFTINLWVKKGAGTKSFGTILQGKTDAAQYGKGLVFYANPGGNADKMELQVSQNTNSTNAKQFDLPTGKWTMLTFVNKADSMEFYVDGVAQQLTDEEKKSLSVNNGLSRIIVGAGQWNKNEYLVGNIDEVSIYNSSLKASQVQALYKLVKPVISGISVDAKQEDFTFMSSTLTDGVAPIQNALKALKINVTMQFGQAPEFKNDEDWTLTETETGYKATKKLTIPEGYGLAEGVSDTLEVNVIVKNAVLDSIAVTTPPSKLYYNVGEEFDPTGMVVTATYDDQSTKNVTKDVTITSTTVVSPDDASAATGEQKVIISYTEGEVTRTAEQKIMVINPGTPEGGLFAARTAYYTFDDTLGNAMAPASAKLVVAGTLKDAAADAVANYVAGKKGNGISLGDAASAATKTNIVKLDKTVTSNKFTINLWVNPTKLGTGRNYAAVLFGESTNQGRDLAILASSNGQADAVRLYNQNTKKDDNHDGGEVKFVNNVLAEGTWTMLTWVNDGETMKLYKDGEATPIYEGESKITKTARLYLGGCWWDSPFCGIIDEVSVFDGTALTAEQVALLKAEAAE